MSHQPTHSRASQHSSRGQEPKWIIALSLPRSQRNHNTPQDNIISTLTFPLQVTAYLDNTCSMPTSEALTSTNSPCYFLGPAEDIGSFKASCSRPSTSTGTGPNDSPPPGQEEGSATTSPGLQSTPTNGGSSTARAVREGWARGSGRGWLEMGIKALMAMGAMEIVWL